VIDALWLGKVTAGLAENNGTVYRRVCDYVTCGLTAKKPGSSPSSTLVDRAWNYFHFSAEVCAF